MDQFLEFEKALQDCLNHLHSQDFQPSPILYEVISGSRREQYPEHSSHLQTLKEAIIAAIQMLKPDENTLGYARKKRLYAILDCRYNQKLTQEMTAELLSITPRHLRREQAAAVRELALFLWKKKEGEGILAKADQQAQTPETGREAQVKQEVSAFRESVSVEAADVRENILRVTELVAPLMSQHNIRLRVDQPPAGIETAVNPSALRQILVRAVLILTRGMAGGDISISAEPAEDSILLLIQATPVAADHTEKDPLIQELITSYQGAWEVDQQGACLCWKIWLPTTKGINVLVVDDNPDLIYTYQRYVQGTRYRLFSTHNGLKLFETIRAVSADIIVLDVMLPDVDGWELLSSLHEHPDTRHLPVIVCSVVEEEELAHALGAKGYLSKPVRYHEFIRTLDEASVWLKQERG